MFWLRKFKEKIQGFDMFELGNSWVIYYILMFGLMPFYQILHVPSRTIRDFVNQGVNLIDGRAFFYLLLGLIGFVLGYKFIFWEKLALKIPNIFKREWDLRRSYIGFAVTFLLAFAVKVIRVIEGGYFHLNKNPDFTNSPFFSLIGLLDWLGPASLAIAFGFYFFLLKKGDLNYKKWKSIAWAVFIFEFLFGFLSGSKFSAIIPIIIYLIVKHYLYSRSYLRLIVAGLLIFFVIMPVTNFYKDKEILSRSYTVSVQGKETIKPLGVAQFMVDSGAGRVGGQVRIFKAILEKTDQFLYGKTLLNFFTTLGPPRFIWKDKPLSVNAGGNELGRKIGVLGEDDFGTSIGPTVPGDWYMNFGVAGIIFGMAFLGFVLRFIYEYLIKASLISLSGVMIYSIFWIQIIKGMEDWIAPVWAGLVKIFIILLIIHFFLSKSQSANSKS